MTHTIMANNVTIVPVRNHLTYALLRNGKWQLIAILVLAFVTRVGYLGTLGYIGDMTTFNGPWAKAIHSEGLFNIYSADKSANYPPIYMGILWLSGTLQPPYNRILLQMNFVIVLKLFSVAAELAIIALVYRWLPSNHRIKWLLPLGIAVYPGLIATSAFWGQSDSLLGLFIALALLALNKDRPRAAWLWFALALLMKFQAVVLLPLMGILTFRRYGWQRTFGAVLLAALLFGLIYLPFIVANGTEYALRPYLGTVDQYPIVTANAFNLWFATTPGIWSSVPANIGLDVPRDTTLWLGNLTYKQVGLYLFAAQVAVICWIMWRQSRKRYEFVWASALYLAFFVLPTQIHERYLYQAALLAVIAIDQEKTMLWVAAGLVVTYTYNIIAITDKPFVWLGIDFFALLGNIALVVALLNLLLLMIMNGIMLWRARPIPIPAHD
ncbi:MAG: glycosyltransferase 87 family protein [Anaerolineae bacterium]